MRKDRYVKRHFHKKSLTLVLALALSCVLLVCGVVGGTLAWLTADTAPVVNTFTTSDISIELNETTGANYKMIPGWTIAKNPKVTVSAESEDCWLFVKITESIDPDLDTYISYAIADRYDPTNNPDGWQIVQEENGSGEIVIGRKVYNSDTTREFAILGTGSYTDPMGTTSANTNCTCGASTNEEHGANCKIIVDDVTVNWSANQVCVKPSVTKQMMEDLEANGATKPTLTFTAYASQYWKQNGVPFSPEDAWKNIPGNP